MIGRAAAHEVRQLRDGRAESAKSRVGKVKKLAKLSVPQRIPAARRPGRDHHSEPPWFHHADARHKGHGNKGMFIHLHASLIKLTELSPGGRAMLLMTEIMYRAACALILLKSKFDRVAGLS
jgi:hypothetical protein